MKFNFKSKKGSDSGEMNRMSSAQEDLDRYEQLLDDWKPGPQNTGKKPSPTMTKNNDPLGGLGERQPTPRPTQTAQSQRPQPTMANRPQPTTANRPQPTMQPTPASAPMPEPPMMDPFTMGSILLLNGRTLIVYKQKMSDKHLVMMLCPNGSIKVQALPLQSAKIEMIGQQIEHLGELPQEYFDQLKQRGRWERDLVIFHCYSYEDARRVPMMMGGAPASTAQHTPVPTEEMDQPSAEQMMPERPAPATAPPVGPIRGQRLCVKFGARDWDAVYWGKDDQGTVVAHHTNDQWALMHLDLDRFGTGLEIDPEIDATLVKEIEASLKG